MSPPSIKPRNIRRSEPTIDAAGAESPDPPPAKARAKSAAPPATKPARPAGAPRFPRLAKALDVVRLGFGAVIVISATAGAAWGAKRYVMTSPRFAIKNVVVTGNARLGPQEVADLGGVHLGDNVFALDVDGVRHRIEDDPWIDHAEVARKLPSGVIITITEHEPVVLVSIGDHLFLAARTGKVIKEVGEGDPIDFPIVTGIDAEDVARDREGQTQRIVKALDLIAEIEKTKIGARWPLQEVHLEKDGTMGVIVGRDAIAIQLGHPPFRGKLEQAERVFDELAKKKSEASIVFLDNDQSPERVVVRMR